MAKFVCNACGEKFECDTDEDGLDVDGDDIYCPECGSDDVDEQDDEDDEDDEDDGGNVVPSGIFIGGEPFVV
jgi:DNA-directed RNA polymerase subunit RPC12/RpoP